MKRLLLSLLAWASTGALSAAPDCHCGADQCTPACACVETSSATPADPGHPLKGVVQTVMADRQALLVKHEEIPGVMRAMTMMLRVAPVVLSQVKAGDAITAQLHHSEDGVWYLDEVKVVPADT